MINESLLRFFNGFHHNAHPMAMVSAVVASMAAFYHDSMDIHNPRHREIFAHRIIAKMPTIAAAAYKHSLGQPFVYPRNDLDYCANMLHMFFAVPCEEYEVDPVAAAGARPAVHPARRPRAEREHLDGAPRGLAPAPIRTRRFPPASRRCGARRTAARTRPCSRCSRRSARVDNIPKYLAMAKDKDANFRLMGFGHRVYKNFDPRAKIIREMCHKVLAQARASTDNPLFELALRLEEIALKDEYFVARKLYPNVDFYSGIIYSALGIPRSMFTVMFAIARTVGLGRALAGDDRRSGDEDRPPAPALHRADAAGLRRRREARLRTRSSAESPRRPNQAPQACGGRAWRPR